jgi:hypothetical protein
LLLAISFLSKRSICPEKLFEVALFANCRRDMRVVAEGVLKPFVGNVFFGTDLTHRALLA